MSGLAIWLIVMGTVLICAPASVGRWCARVRKAYDAERNSGGNTR